MKLLKVYSTLVIILLCSPIVALCNVDPGPDTGAPIDGGVSILIAAGVGYGLKKVRDHRKKSKQKETIQ